MGFDVIISLTTTHRGECDDAIICGSAGYEAVLRDTQQDMGAEEEEEGEEEELWPDQIWFRKRPCNSRRLSDTNMDWQYIIYRDLNLGAIFDNDELISSTDVHVTVIPMGRVSKLAVPWLRDGYQITLLQKCKIFCAPSLTVNYFNHLHYYSIDRKQHRSPNHNWYVHLPPPPAPS